MRGLVSVGSGYIPVAGCYGNSNEISGFKAGFGFLAQLIACRFLEKNFALWSTMTSLTDAEESHDVDVTVEGACYIFLEFSALLNNMFCCCVSLTVDSWLLTILVPVRQGSYLYVFFLKLLQASIGHDHVKGHRTVPGDSIHSTVTTHVIEMRDNVTVTFKMNIWNLKLKRYKGLKATWNIEIQF